MHVVGVIALVELADCPLRVGRHCCDVAIGAIRGEASPAPSASSGQRADLARRDGTARDRRIRVGAGQIAVSRGAIELRVAAGNALEPLLPGSALKPLLPGIALRSLRKLSRREVPRSK